MCQVYETRIIYQGGGCMIGKCDKVDRIVEECTSKPSSGVESCANYKYIVAGSSKRGGPHPGHAHAPPATNASSNTAPST
ncbi:hypothetical protein L228DRAFT_242419 [Xylona heveae TC161]|uniref:Uncharacterized protein n=1 Tax=Xylona heveae (strain CBS 132557 / TC161) TaxID=1328760 RepID=A0A165JBX5_XYLHT|nr:hypothetical protein L228DRAFT_242419 [Xylona heveae TC161]KZF26029.1 hypothetical protein L228DRAFT_242419 [Xylona heveae TC161]